MRCSCWPFECKAVSQVRKYVDTIKLHPPVVISKASESTSEPQKVDRDLLDKTFALDPVCSRDGPPLAKPLSIVEFSKSESEWVRLLSIYEDLSEEEKQQRRRTDKIFPEMIEYLRACAEKRLFRINGLWECKECGKWPRFDISSTYCEYCGMKNRTTVSLETACPSK